MAVPSPPEITVLLQAWRLEDQSALEQLVPLVEAELHRLAHRYLAQDCQQGPPQPAHLLGAFPFGFISSLCLAGAVADEFFIRSTTALNSGSDASGCRSGSSGEK